MDHLSQGFQNTFHEILRIYGGDTGFCTFDLNLIKFFLKKRLPLYVLLTKFKHAGYHQCINMFLFIDLITFIVYKVYTINKEIYINLTFI